MAHVKYAFKGYNKETMAKVTGRDLPISTKDGIEICNFIRNKKLDAIKAHLELTILEKKPIPFKRFTNGHGHKRGKGMAAGRYPVKASKIFLDLLKSAEANALAKGLSANHLKIVHALTNIASRPYKAGRRVRGEMKRSHTEFILEEVGKPKRTPTTKKKAVPKKEINVDKPAVKKEEPKVVEKKPEPKKEVKEEKKIPKAEAPKKEETKPAAEKPKAEPAKAEEKPAKTKVEVKDKKEEIKPEPKPVEKIKVTVTEKNEDNPKK